MPGQSRSHKGNDAFVAKNLELLPPSLKSSNWETQFLTLEWNEITIAKECKYDGHILECYKGVSVCEGMKDETTKLGKKTSWQQASQLENASSNSPSPPLSLAKIPPKERALDHGSHQRLPKPSSIMQVCDWGPGIWPIHLSSPRLGDRGLLDPWEYMFQLCCEPSPTVGKAG